ncbi:hypothetical protein BDV95DRAFT_583531 [Massariosphaeria phaeospora]|uniref:Uncharacterized protein n=1 Tax=Massariosphaeria phaeospora TaxID=100035 RepID=A0A7C8M2Z7_9PLEO|nr:hypothetical protein BDV95DRAFT_583531 [Massariosphaeria phaeospora]
MERFFRGGLRTIDVQVAAIDSDPFCAFFERLFSSATRDLERLAIAFTPPPRDDNDDDDADEENNELVAQRRRMWATLASRHEYHVHVEPHAALRQLSLTEVDLTASWSELLLHILDVPRMTHLTLIRCRGDAAFLEAFGRAGCSSLQYLFVQFSGAALDSDSDADSDTDMAAPPVDVDACLAPIYTSCTRLSSLHLHWREGQTPSCTLSHIATLGAHLRCLSLDYTPRDGAAPDVALDDEGRRRGKRSALSVWKLAVVCRACARLEQLGYRIRDEALEPKKWELVDRGVHLGEGAAGLRITHLEEKPKSNTFVNELKCLTTLRHLHTLHFRTHHLHHHPTVLAAHLASALQPTTLTRFAALVFAHIASPRLRALIYGSEFAAWHTDRQAAALLDWHVETVPQHRFARARGSATAAGRWRPR